MFRTAWKEMTCRFFILTFGLPMALVLFGCATPESEKNQPATTPEIAGVWRGSWTSAQGAYTGKLFVVIKESGDSISGALSIDSSLCLDQLPLSISGTYSSNNVAFGIVSGSDEVQYLAQVRPNSMSGSYSVISGGCQGEEGTFSLARNADDTVTVSGTFSYSEYQSGAFAMYAVANDFPISYDSFSGASVKAYTLPVPINSGEVMLFTFNDTNENAIPDPGENFAFPVINVTNTDLTGVDIDFGSQSSTPAPGPTGSGQGEGTTEPPAPGPTGSGQGEGTTESPVPLAIGTPHAGMVAGFGGQSYYTFTTGATAATYTISLTGVTSGVFVDLFSGGFSPSPAFAFITSCDYSQVAAGETCTTLMLDANTTYFLLVNNYSADPGSFTLTVSLGSPTGQSEGTAQSPVALTIGTPHAGIVGTLGQSFYTFTTGATTVGYLIALTGLTTDVAWSLYGNNLFTGTPILNCDAFWAIADEICTTPTLPANTSYYILVSNNGATSDSYALGVSVSGGATSALPFVNGDGYPELTAAPTFTPPSVASGGTVAVIVPVDSDTRQVMVVLLDVETQQTEDGFSMTPTAGSETRSLPVNVVGAAGNYYLQVTLFSDASNSTGFVTLYDLLGSNYGKGIISLPSGTTVGGFADTGVAAPVLTVSL